MTQHYYTRYLTDSSDFLSLGGSLNNYLVYAMGGDDFVATASGKDTIYGGKGSDTLSCGTGNDNFIYGEEGGDSLVGGFGVDFLDGGEGNDWLDAGGDVNVESMVGGIGDDTYFFRAEDVVVEHEGQGRDLLIVENFIGPSLYIAFGVEDISQFNVSNLSRDNSYRSSTKELNVYGNDLSNFIQGSASANILGGGRGDDTLRAAGGDDFVDGGSGKDVLWGENGNDTIVAGSGGDTIRAGVGDDLVITCDVDVNGVFVLDSDVDHVGLESGRKLIYAQVNDVIEFVGGGWTSESSLVLVGDVYGDYYIPDGVGVLKHVDVEASADFIQDNVKGDLNLYSNEADIEIYGTGGANKIYGGIGQDSIVALAGNDYIFGGDGADSLLGGDGNDFISGGSGDDFIDGGSGADTIEFSADFGFDYLRLGYGDREILNFVGAAKTDLLFALSGADLMISVKEKTDVVKIADYQIGSDQVGAIKASDGFYLDGAALERVVQSMASFSGASMIAASNFWVPFSD